MVIQNEKPTYQDFSIGEREDSTILKALKNIYWLFDNYQNLLLKNVFEITIDDLNDGYTKEHDDIEKLIEALGLKLDKVKQFEKENPDLVVITKEEKDEFEKYKREKAKKEQDELTEDVWNPDYAPDDVGTNKAKIREFINPISLWKDGGIYAHPINIKL